MCVCVLVFVSTCRGVYMNSGCVLSGFMSVCLCASLIMIIIVQEALWRNQPRVSADLKFN